MLPPGWNPDGWQMAGPPWLELAVMPPTCLHDSLKSTHPHETTTPWSRTGHTVVRQGCRWIWSLRTPCCAPADRGAGSRRHAWGGNALARAPFLGWRRLG